MTLEKRSVLVLALLGAALVCAYIGQRHYGASAPWKPRRFERTEVMVSMRDGVKLQTVFFVPKEAHDPLPILFTRTPYGVPVDETLLDGDPYADLVADGYVFAFQNLRGRFDSEGTFVMMRPPRDRSNPSAVDESTDAYDTIEWLVHNVPKSAARVCMWGTSYPGWTTTMALLDPHPALKCVSERASPSDMFRNDDFHHNGAFRLSPGLEFSALMERSKEFSPFELDQHDAYDWYLHLGALSHVDERYLHGKVPTWEDFVQHPNRDGFWQRQAIGTYLRSTTVPNLNVAGWWDQEDFVGPLDIYERLERNDRDHLNFLVVGPWNHGGWGSAARKLGDIDFGADTAQDFRAGAQRRWFAHWLRDAPALDLPEALVFETGTNRWRSFDRWPPKAATPSRRLFLRANGKLSFDLPPETDGDAFDAYVSDPANPVPYRRRPIEGGQWSTWLVQDQRFVDHRPDVLTWEGDALDHDIVIAGDILSDLYASTSGTDSDWVVKLIDVQPEANPAKDIDAGAYDFRGYELMVAGEILRARFRKNDARPEPVPADEIVEYFINLHTRAHAFLAGHRIMVQIQSTWFPVYDRNPQKYVDNIFEASDADYVKATQRVFRSRQAPTSIVLPVLE